MSVVTNIIGWIELSERFTIIDGEIWRNMAKGRVKRVPTNPRKSGYVAVRYGQKYLYYHRVLYMLHHKVNLTEEQKIDHIIEGNKSDNRIENLQVLSHADNCMKAKVHILPKRTVGGNYELAIYLNKNRIYLGQYDTDIEYWASHNRMTRLFGLDTKGLEFARALNKDDAKEFVQLAMVA